MPRSALGEFRKPLIVKIGAMVARHQFTWKPRPNGFHKTIARGRSSLTLAFRSHGYFSFDVTASVAVRFSEVEELTADPRLPQSSRANTVTLGRELGNIRDGFPLSWTVAEEDDVVAAAHSIVDIFEEVGLPYLHRYSDPEEALAVLSRNDAEGWDHMPAHDARCTAAVALAFVLGRHELVDDLIRSSEHFLATQTDSELRSFIDFVNRLRTIHRRG